MKSIKILAILSITLLYLILLFVMWTNSHANSDVINLKLQLLAGEGFGLYYFIISTCCLFLLWFGVRFSFGQEMIETTQTKSQLLFKVISLFLFEFQIILLTFEMWLEASTIQFLIGIFSTAILGIFSFSVIYDMIKGFGDFIRKKN